jgi:hypothetical protein
LESAERSCFRSAIEVNHRLDEGLLSEANLEKFGSGNQSRVGRLVVGAASIIVFVEMAVHDSLFQVAQRAELLDQIALYRGRKKEYPPHLGTCDHA